MKDRPDSITVIAWLIIAFSVLMLVSLSVTAAYLDDPKFQEIFEKYPKPRPIDLAAIAVQLLVTIACAVGMLMGKNWSRYVFMGMQVAGIILGILALSINASILLNVMIVILIGYYLFSPKANEFFTQQKPPDNEGSRLF